jgi:hypothetical protein
MAEVSPMPWTLISRRNAGMSSRLANPRVYLQI